MTVWIFRHGDRIYVPSRSPQRKYWVRYLLEDPRVRLRVGDRIYERRAVRVESAAEIDAIVPALLEKYDVSRPEDPEDAPEVWFFRLDPAGAG